MSIIFFRESSPLRKKTGLEYLFVGHGEYEIQRGISELLPARKRNFKVTQMQES